MPYYSRAFRSKGGFNDPANDPANDPTVTVNTIVRFDAVLLLIVSYNTERFETMQLLIS